MYMVKIIVLSENTMKPEENWEYSKSQKTNHKNQNSKYNRGFKIISKNGYLNVSIKFYLITRFYPECRFLMNLFTPVNKRSVGSGNNKFQKVSGNKNLEEYFCFENAVKRNDYKNSAVDNLRNHCACIISDPQMFMCGIFILPEMKSPHIMMLRKQISR